jgi:Arc/MetJ family transcription regulator
MATNLAIDDKLLTKAKRVGRFRTKKETVTVALRQLIERMDQKRILKVMHTFDFRDDWDYKKERGKREHLG